MLMMVKKQPESETEPLVPEPWIQSRWFQRQRYQRARISLWRAQTSLWRARISLRIARSSLWRVPRPSRESQAMKRVEDADSAQDRPDEVAKKAQELRETIKYAKKTQDKINVKEIQEMGKK